MRSFLIPSLKLFNKIFLCAIIILIRQLIDNLIIRNQFHAVRSIFIEIYTSEDLKI